MAPIEILLGDQNGYWSQLTFQSIKGVGKIQPTLRLVFYAKGMRADTKVLVVQSSIRLFLKDEYLGKGDMVEVGPALLTYNPTELNYDVQISHLAIDYAQQHFVDYNLPLQIVMNMLLVVKFENENAVGNVVPQGHEWKNQWHFISLPSIHPVPSPTRLNIPQGDWITKVMNPLSINEHILIEMPIPPIPSDARWKNALNHLKQAEERLIAGDDAGVLASCHAAFEAVAKNGEYKRIFDKITDNKKREQVDALFAKAKAYFDAGRHTSKQDPQQGEFAVDHRDATFALGLARMFIAYTAQLLVEYPGD